MMVTEEAIRGQVPIRLGGKQVATAWHEEYRDELGLRFANGTVLILESVIDISEQIDVRRIFVIEGASDRDFVLFGGSVVAWLNCEGVLTRTMRLYREDRNAEFWTTEFISEGSAVVVVYETGVLLISEELEVRWHVLKCFTEEFAGWDSRVVRLRAESGDERLVPISES